MSTYHQEVIARAKAHGSTAETLKGAVKYCLAHKLTRSKPTKPNAITNLDDKKVGDAIELSRDVLYGFKFAPLWNREAQEFATKIIGNQGKHSNVSGGSPRVYGPAAQQRYETIRYNGAYKGYTGSHLYQDYQSCVAISRSGRSALVITSCVLRRRIIAPNGMRFERDGQGILLRRLSDNMDYHPTSDEWFSTAFATSVRKNMAANYAARIAAKRAEKIKQAEAKRNAAEAARIMEIRKREIGSVRVTLEDSRRAGNCIEGSLRYAEQNFGVSRNEIIAGGYLFSLPARLVMRNATERAKAAVNIAWNRETAVQI